MNFKTASEIKRNKPVEKKTEEKPPTKFDKAESEFVEHKEERNFENAARRSKWAGLRDLYLTVPVTRNQVEIDGEELLKLEQSKEAYFAKVKEGLKTEQAKKVYVKPSIRSVGRGGK